MQATFSAYERALAKRSRPVAFVDLDAFEGNVRSVLARAQGAPVRLASKSLRCPELMRQALASSEQLQGLMCFHGKEACLLAEQGFDDLLVAYPTTDEKGYVRRWLQAARLC